MRRALLVLLVLAMALGMAVPASADAHLGDPAKVAICHFGGHEAGTTFGQGGFTGDYVINFGTDGPTPDYCEETLGEYAGVMIVISMKALTAHDVEGMDRVDFYPNGWKG